MRYFSLNQKNNSDKPTVSFQTAVKQSLAPDKGLYYPLSVPRLPDSVLREMESMTKTEIALHLMAPYVEEDIPQEELQKIVSETVDFDFPLVRVSENIYSLELFHGPTMAFKDVGARFMARCLGYFNRKKPEEKTRVLVATSGDTGGAVANGFLNVEGVEVIILYPKGKVSDIQQRQLTTLGHNITALEVDGVFDDCQDMVKKAFVDSDLNHLNLTSANSINVARWLPQMIYYFYAWQEAKKHDIPLHIAVPSGNFGNICAGMVAWKMGLPAEHFVAATNVNDTVPRFMETGDYAPKPSTQTISNAMDVGNPSNFIRILNLTENKESLEQIFSSYSFSDAATKATMKSVYEAHGYVLDPHGAVGYLGLTRWLKSQNKQGGVFLETAHPVKFKDIVEKELGIIIEIPPQIMQLMHREKKYQQVHSYSDLKEFLLD
ncbi:threonine synthase [Robertkochia aurantiaca]|uniref:threonine synthase n=1 Tax=Robertkochia aurantiaca TaxID=2873700 RepID=UPI001CD0291B|nr:threonine synthase [Robertkochia sp. 3YJGBD-33]